MKADWKNETLGDVINLKRGHDLPKRLRKEGNIPIYSSSGFSGYHNEAKSNDIGVITGRYGTIGQVFLVKEPFWPLNTALYVENFKGNDEVFIYYFLQQIEWKKFNDKSAVPGINRNDIHKEEVLLPPLPTQKKIAHVLSILDDKIGLNRKMNQTLEEMAQALFKSWFVDFDPVHAKAKAINDADREQITKELGISKEVLDLFPDEFEESDLGMIPEGWSASTIEDEVSIYGGATPSTKEPKYWENGTNHWTTPRDLSGLSSKILIDTARKITDEGVNKIGSKQLPIGTVLLSSRAPVGYIAYSTVPISINQGYIAMVCDQKLSNYHIMYWLDIAMDEIKNRAGGTTFSEISKKSFRPIKLVVPEKNILSKFNTSIEPIVNKIIQNEKQIKTLQKTRDTLLPKLLSGELDVSELKLGIQ